MPEIRVMYDSKNIKPRIRKILSVRLPIIIAKALLCGPEDVLVLFHKFDEYDQDRGQDLLVIIDAHESASRLENIIEINQQILDGIYQALNSTEAKPSQPILLFVWTRLSPGAFADAKITKA